MSKNTQSATCPVYPTWCNRPHRPGSDPERLVHTNSLHFKKSIREHFTFYVCEPNGFHPEGSGAFSIYRGRYERWRLWLSGNEMRELGTRLIEMADAAAALEPRPTRDVEEDEPVSLQQVGR